jgi:hypothetical protein
MVKVLLAYEEPNQMEKFSQLPFTVLKQDDKKRKCSRPQKAGKSRSYNNPYVPNWSNIRKDKYDGIATKKHVR